MIEGLLMLVGITVVLILINTRTRYTDKSRGWKVKKNGNSFQIYSELDKDNNWRSISFECKMYSKDVPRHSIIINKDWTIYPEWAQLRKDEILSRLRSVLKEPTYTIIDM